MTAAEQQLRQIAALFLGAVALHGADHLRRGAGVITDLALAWAAVRVRRERASTPGGPTRHSPVGAATS